MNYPVAHGKVTFCQECGGSGDNGSYHGSSRCFDCGGYGLLFEGKDFSTSLTTTTVVPDAAGATLIRPADDLHRSALLTHHREILKSKWGTVQEYMTAKVRYEGARKDLLRIKINPEDVDQHSGGNQ